MKDAGFLEPESPRSALSNTGYALLANALIQKIDTAYSASVPPLSAAELLAISLTDPYAPPNGFK